MRSSLCKTVSPSEDEGAASSVESDHGKYWQIHNFIGSNITNGF